MSGQRLTIANVRAHVLAHLSAQAMRDIMCLKPSLLQEISKG